MIVKRYEAKNPFRYETVKVVDASSDDPDGTLSDSNAI